MISVAKLVLTTLCAGIHPNRTLAVVLDCGTDNEELLNDDLYLGLKEKRVRGEQYDKFVDTFVQSTRKLYPRAYIHFEDFGLSNGKGTCINTIHIADCGQLEEFSISIVRRSPASTMMSKEQVA